MHDSGALVYDYWDGGVEYAVLGVFGDFGGFHNHMDIDTAGVSP